MTSLAEFVGYFLVVSAVTSVVQCLVRYREPTKVYRESAYFFSLIVGGIVAFSTVVYFLEWIFIRKP